MNPTQSKPAAASGSYKKAAVYLGHLLVLLSLVFIAFQLKDDFKSIPTFTLGLSEILSFGIAVLCNALAVFVLASAWFLLLGGEVNLRLRDAFSILGRSQMGKYLPGNIFQYVGRVSIGSSYNLPSRSTILTTGIETVLMILTAVALALVAYVFDRRLIEFLNIQSRSLYIFVVLGIALVFLAAAISIRSVRARNWIRAHLVFLKPKRLIQASVLYLILFTLFGLSLKVLLVMLGEGPNSLSLFQLSSGYALAWVLGFITPGAPVGIGIREAVFFQLYHNQLGDGFTIGLALVARLAATAGDLVAFLLAYLFHDSKNRHVR